MANWKKPEEIALDRYKIIAPIIAAMEEKADGAKLAMLKQEVCEQWGISARTLRRWVTAYSENGFEGIKPADRRGGSSVIPDELIMAATGGVPRTV